MAIVSSRFLISSCAMKPLVHEHFLLRAEVENPSTNRRQVTKFLNKLVKKIKMKTMYGPVTSICKQEGNRGITAFAIIETSHIFNAFYIFCISPVFSCMYIYTFLHSFPYIGGVG